MSFDFQVYAWLKKILPSHLVEIIMFMTHETMSMRLYVDLMSISIEMNVKHAIHEFQNGSKWSIAQEMRVELDYVGERAFGAFMYAQVVEHIEYAFVSRFFFSARIYECTTYEQVEKYPGLKVDIHGMTRYADVVICAHLSGATVLDFTLKLREFEDLYEVPRIEFEDFSEEYQVYDIRYNLYGCRLFRGALYKFNYVRSNIEFDTRFGQLTSIV